MAEINIGNNRQVRPAKFFRNHGNKLFFQFNFLPFQNSRGGQKSVAFIISRTSMQPPNNTPCVIPFPWSHFHPLLFFKSLVLPVLFKSFQSGYPSQYASYGAYS